MRLSGPGTRGRRWCCRANERRRRGNCLFQLSKIGKIFRNAEGVLLADLDHISPCFEGCCSPAISSVVSQSFFPTTISSRVQGTVDSECIASSWWSQSWPFALRDRLPTALHMPRVVVLPIEASLRRSASDIRAVEPRLRTERLFMHCTPVALQISLQSESRRAERARIAEIMLAVDVRSP